MNPVSESRYLPSFLAIAASLVLVCGALLLLTSTAPWSLRPDAGSEASAPVAADGITQAAVPATIAFAPPSNHALPPAHEGTAEADRGETAEVAEAQQQEIVPEPAGAGNSDPSSVPAEDVVAASGAPPIDETPADAAHAAEVDATQTSTADISQVEEANAAAADVAQVAAAETETAAAEAIAAESMSVSEAEPMPQDTLAEGAVREIAAADAAPAAATDQIGALLAESPPAAIASETIAEHDNEGAKPSPEATSAEKAEAPGEAAAQAPGEGAGGHPREARAEVTAAAPPAPPPPLPKRKPEIAPKVPMQAARSAPGPEPASRAAAPKQTQTRPAVAQATPAQSGGFKWLPMALAPADKPVAKEPARLTGAAYSSKVWSALARKKPRAGQSGSATVTFTIGWGGALSSVSIAKSSGNARIDQLALATVRGAAPFPPPASGPASFTIRIDFH